MTYWKTEEELTLLVKRELYTAVVGDILDVFGLHHQFLPPRIQPLRDDMVVFGKAMPVVECDTTDAPPAQPFGLMLEALDDLQPGEVYLCSGASPQYALWGELMSARALQCGAEGAVVDGYARDTRGIVAQNFPCFSYGRYSQDQAPRGHVTDFRVPLQIEKVRVKPGDYVFGDLEGVCIIPAAIRDEVLMKAIEKARGEKTVFQAIQQGMSARAAFAKYGIM